MCTVQRKRARCDPSAVTGRASMLRISLKISFTAGAVASSRTADATVCRGQVRGWVGCPQIMGKIVRPVATKVMAMSAQNAAKSSCSAREAPIIALAAEMAAAGAPGSVRLFSLRQEFPGEWARFRAQQPAPGARAELAITLRPEHFPYWSQGRLGAVQRVDLVARSSRAAPPATLEVFSAASDQPNPARREQLTTGGFGPVLLGHYTGGATGLQLPASPLGEWKLYFEDNEVAEVMVAVGWQRA